LASFANRPEVKDMIKREISTFLRENGCKGFEIPADIHIHSELFSVENGLFTPTFKLKRNVAAEMFKQQLSDMYGAKSNLH
jgi:long-chain acyl-CoA synthetase